jgi:hypothetical protein
MCPYARARARVADQHVVILKLISSLLPRLELMEKQTGKEVHGHVEIHDLKYFGMKHFYMPLLLILKDTTQIDQDYYPEFLGRIFVVNTPKMFTAVWKIIKKWLDPIVQEKVTILGADFREALLKEIDAANLPGWLGGTCSCPNGCVPSVQDLSGVEDACDTALLVFI